MSMLKCAQCEHENDFTRVFCQNCGARLEHSAGVMVPPVAEPGAPAQPPSQMSRRRNSPPKTESNGVAGSFIKKIFSTALIAALLAAIILILRPPENLPPKAPANNGAADRLSKFLQEAAQSPYPRIVEITQDQINSYLASKVVAVSNAEGAALYRPQFERAFVIIEQGSLRFCIEQKISGYSFYEYMDIALGANGSVITWENTSGGIGRLGLPKQGLFVLRRSFDPLFAALQDVQNIFASAHEITLSPGRARVRWAGKKPGP